MNTTTAHEPAPVTIADVAAMIDRFAADRLAYTDPAADRVLAVGAARGWCYRVSTTQVGWTEDGCAEFRRTVLADPMRIVAPEARADCVRAPQHRFTVEQCDRFTDRPRTPAAYIARRIGPMTWRITTETHAERAIVSAIDSNGTRWVVDVNGADGGSFRTFAAAVAAASAWWAERCSAYTVAN